MSDNTSKPKGTSGRTVWMLSLSTTLVIPGRALHVARCLFVTEVDQLFSSPREIAEKLRSQGAIQWTEVDMVNNFNIDNCGPLADLPILIED
jgi:hypothetical protein